MDFSQLMPALNVNIGDPIFIGDFFGFLLAIPMSLLLAFWLSAVKNRQAVVVGAFAGTFLGFLIILGWAGTLIFDTPLPGADGGNVFFGSVLLCSILGLTAGILVDLLVARQRRVDYRRPSVHQEQHA